MCLMAAFVPHRPNKYCHVTASNGIVLSSPYTPLAIMTASPIASVRVFEPVRDADVGSLRSVRSQRRRRYREIIMLNNLLLAPHHHQVRRSHRSIYCWHGHAAAPYRASGFVLWHLSDVSGQADDVGSRGKADLTTARVQVRNCEGFRMTAIRDDAACTGAV